MTLRIGSLFSGAGGLLVTAIAYHDVDRTRWGKYEPAIRRWETLTRPAPSPTEPNTKGRPRLHAPFSEWMMGWPAGWCTDVDGLKRNDQLRIIGNGVVPQQAETAIRYLLTIKSNANSPTSANTSTGGGAPRSTSPNATRHSAGN